MSSSSVSPVIPERRPRFSLSTWLANQLRNIAPFLTLIVLVAIFSTASPSFVSEANLFNILQQISVTGIIATGLTFVILCAEIDLSVANVANAVGIVVAYFTVQDASVNIANIPLPGILALLLALAASLGFGFANAFGVTAIGIPSFIMTLAMLQIAAGVCALLVRGQIAYAVPDMIGFLGAGSINVPGVGHVPCIAIVAGLILLIGWFVLTFTRFGRYVYMTGGNREAAEFSGVNTRAIIASVMVISAVCSGIAGMLGVARFGSAQQDEFGDYLLDSISAVVVGGTSLFGGQGGIGNTLVGLFVLGVLNNGLDHVRIDSFLKILIRGLILLLALIVNVYAQRLRTRAARASTQA
jgi:ribose transport system permease protein